MSCAVQNRASLRLSCQHGGAQFCKWLACLYQKISKQKRATDGRRGFLPREQPSGRGSTRRAGLIHPFHLAALRRYYRQLIRTRQISLGDEQSPRRYAAHNESVARFFHHQLTSSVAAIAGEPVNPSYVYVGSYQSGAELEKHTDREQCEFSISLCLDYWPEPQNETPWPLKLQTDSGEVAVFQGIGDGLVYRGPEVPHWRDRLPDGHTSTSIFFHYVAADFAGPLD